MYGHECKKKKSTQVCPAALIQAPQVHRCQFEGAGSGKVLPVSWAQPVEIRSDAENRKKQRQNI